MTIELLPEFIRDHYEVYEWKHACAILYNDFPEEWSEIMEVLTNFRLKKGYITQGGGNKSLEPVMNFGSAHSSFKRLAGSKRYNALASARVSRNHSRQADSK